MLGYLVVAYRLSIRPENSFAASWVLAAAPLAFISGSAVMQNAMAWRVLHDFDLGVGDRTRCRVLRHGSCCSVSVRISRWLDPNNYATLMYLVWIPLVHRYLAQGWRGARDDLAYRHALVLASSFILVLAIIATRSRTALVIVGVAFALWIVDCC